nr:hypothetical protein [Tanacetum cinerariifolium]
MMQRGHGLSLFSVRRTCRNAARLRIMSLFMRLMLSIEHYAQIGTLSRVLFFSFATEDEDDGALEICECVRVLSKKEGFWVRHREANLDIACNHKKPLSQKVLSTNFTKLAEAKTYEII